MSSPTSIRRLQVHFFAVYAVFGSVTPFMPLYLSDLKGLSPTQLGTVFAAGQAAVLIMPMVMTFVADRYRVIRPMLMVLFGLSLVAMTAIAGATGFWACLFWIAFNQMAMQPQVALADGLFFTHQADPTQPKTSFSVVRVWGTFGFIAPSIMFFFAYEVGGTIALLPLITALWAIFGIANSRGLPTRAQPLTKDQTHRMPTWAALKVLLRPPMAFFCVGVGFVIMSNMAFYSFYPLYLTNEVGIAEKWVGPISSLGVVLEILYMLNFERLRKRFGLEGVLLLGGAAIVFRLACLAFFPTPFFAVFFQVFHGLTVIGFLVVPVMYLNAHAEEGYRNSIQGLYMMLVMGIFSIAGNIVAGELAAISLLVLYRGALGFCLCGLALVGIGFHLDRRRQHPTTPVDSRP